MEARYDRGDACRLSDLLETFRIQKQGSMSIDEYFTQLKMLWDEILMLRPIPACTCLPGCSCNIMRAVRENMNAEYEMKFVKGMNDSFE